MIKKINSFSIMLIILSAIISCGLLPDNAFRAAPDADLTTNFRYECSRSFDFSKDSEADNGKCDILEVCIRENMRNTVLATYEPWPLIEKIKPYSSGIYVPVSEMRVNAKDAGPEAMELFDLIYDIRQQCLIEAGLEGIIQDS